MPTAASREAFQKTLASRQFAPAYYLYGEEEHLREEGIRQLVAAATEPATRDFNLDQRKGGEVGGETLATLLGTPPLMAARRVVVIRDVDALRKDARTTVNRYLTKPAPDTLLVLVASNAAKVDKQLADATMNVEFAPLTGAHLPAWIVQHARALGAQITDRAVALLQEAAGDDLAHLALELEKLASYVQDGVISEDAVSAVVGVQREKTLGHLLDAVAEKNAASALAILPIAMEQPKASAVTTVMALTVQTLALAWGESRRLSPARLSGEYYGLLKESGSLFVGRSWGDAVRTWTRCASRWSPAELDRALDALARADLALKESRVSSEEQVLASLILTICSTPARRSAA